MIFHDHSLRFEDKECFKENQLNSLIIKEILNRVEVFSRNIYHYEFKDFYVA